MAKLTRKLWVGIGAATIAGASMTGSDPRSTDRHKAGAPPPAPDGRPPGTRPRAAKPT